MELSKSKTPNKKIFTNISKDNPSKNNTRSEEDYLKKIFILLENKTTLPLSSLTKSLNLRSSSITSMLKKLEEKKLVVYRPYKGVELLPLGRKLALDQIRKHRIWECFLFEKLKFKWDEVHEVAEQLEHIKSDKLISKLDEYLGFPTSDPHGDPIPSKEGELKKLDDLKREDCLLLSKLKANQEGQVMQVLGDKSLLSHLDDLSISLGSQIKVLDRVNYDNSQKIQVDAKASFFISEKIAEKIMLKKTSQEN